MKLPVLLGLRQPVQVEVAGVDYLVQPRSTREWFEAWEEPTPLLALLAPEDSRALAARIWDLDDPLDTLDVTRAWRDALQSASGLPWYSTERLMASLLSQWFMLSGHLALKGIDMLTAPLDFTLAAVAAAATEHMDEKQRRAFDRDLMEPPAPSELLPGEQPVGFDDDEAAAAWKAAATSSAVRGRL